MKSSGVDRRKAFKFMGAGMAGLTVAGFGGEKHQKRSETFQIIYDKVTRTPFIDTHEHLVDESERLQGGANIGNAANDWTLILSHYFDSDMFSAGMNPKDHDLFFSPGLNPVDKWRLLEPFWPAIKNTGYGRSVQITLSELYDVHDLNAKTVKQVQAGYEKLLRPGFYKKILKEKCLIESCQVNAWPVLLKSEMPDFLMSDINLGGMINEPGDSTYCDPAHVKGETLTEWHQAIFWWFEKYGRYAVGAKVPKAYDRKIDFSVTPAEAVEGIYAQLRSGKNLSPEERKKLEDHTFWFAVDLATKMNLPVKVHTGYHAIWRGKTSRMPLRDVGQNPADACDLCQISPETRFVFFHIGYPYYEEMIALAKQYPNAYLDMCWAWIINPIAAKDFLKKYLMTAPANKILTFGGDYVPVEPVLGHAFIARHGISLALSELVDEGWIKLEEAIKLTDPIMHENAKKIFDLKSKTKLLKNLNWTQI